MANDITKFFIQNAIIAKKAAHSPAFAAEKLLEFAAQLRGGKVDEALADWVATAIEKSISIEDAKQNKAKDRMNATEFCKALGLTAPIKHGHQRPKVDPIDAGREMAQLINKTGITQAAACKEIKEKYGIKSDSTMLKYFHLYKEDRRKRRDDFRKVLDYVEREMLKNKEIAMQKMAVLRQPISQDFFNQLRKQAENIPE